ncbi:hypothetical protein [Dactylosporangium sp. NPDC005555]|uniref:hypothetical protein n=1 Tax=Dactylosporangium sp. NPDC005555 TaxID=3154889 RepID=UPI0033AB2C60
MVVRLVRAGVGVLLLLIAVPLAIAGGGLWVAMEHRAADDTFTARLERLRSGGRAVVVPDVDALLRADAPFARGGQTTLSLSAVGSSGPLFVGLAPDEAVQEYLDGLVQARVSRVRLARGPLPVELTEVETRAAAATAARPGSAAGQVPGSGPAVAGPGTAGPAVPGDPNAGAQTDPNAGGQADPDAGAQTDPNAGGQADPSTGGQADPNATAGQADPNAATGGPADPNAAAGGPGAGDPNATSSATGATATGGGSAVPLAAPGTQAFWLAKGVTVGGAAELTWSPSAMRGRHLALVVMNADGTAGINATVTARLAPAWIGPTAGGLLMLGAALFLLAVLILAWPTRRAAERLVLPTVPSQPTKSRVSLRRNLSTLSEPIAALLNPVVPKETPKDTKKNTTNDTGSQAATKDAASGDAVQDATSKDAASKDAASGDAVQDAAGQDVENHDGRDAHVVTVAVTIEATEITVGEDETKATAADDGRPEVGPAAVEGGSAAVHAARQTTGQTELDRPAPAGAIDDEDLALPPLPKLPPIELQFTWAPVAVEEEPDQQADQQEKAATASWRAARPAVTTEG